MSQLKTVILAGGKGSRLEEITKVIPKPLVKLGRYPIIIYIIKLYLKYGVRHFIIALGYKSEKILEYFLNKKINQNFLKNFKKGYTIKKKIFKINCTITFLYTGLKTMTGGRVKRAGKLINDKNFFLTYGDGVSDVNLNKLKYLHNKKKKLVTVTAVRPPARFGELKISNNNVKYFSEKKTIKTSWINGGFFIINKKFLKYIKNDNSILERSPLELMAKKKQLIAFKHNGFWQCMDTKRDIDKLKEILKKKY